jgi:CBS domain-containing protein
MTTRFLAVRESATAQEAIEAIRRHTEEEVEQIFYLYVTDDGGRLRGVVPIRKLVTARENRSISEIMISDPVAVEATADQEQAAQVAAKYNLLAVPVIDDSRRLLGVITVDDVIDVIKEEATEDMYRMVGLTEEEHVYTPLAKVIRGRLPWMVVNLGTAFLASWVVGLFESSIRAVSVLAVFMPIVAGMGGNGGTQTLTVVTRGIALGELEADAAVRAMLREVSGGADRPRYRPRHRPSDRARCLFLAGIGDARPGAFARHDHEHGGGGSLGRGGTARAAGASAGPRARLGSGRDDVHRRFRVPLVPRTGHAFAAIFGVGRIAEGSRIP